LNRHFQYGSKTIDYVLQFTERKSLGITVTPDMDVIVKAPLNAKMERIEELLVKRASWILKQQSFFLAYYPKQLPKKYISGETHLYLGRQYRLKVRMGKTESVKLHGKFINVLCQDNSRVKQLLNSWYKDHAQVKFRAYCQEWAGKFKGYTVPPPDIQIRTMSKRWGSCTAKGKIILNPELIRAPKGCIEYVIVHELCHLVHHSHNAKFIELQSHMMPTWDKWKDRLERMLA
jgi:hypothetical protein